MDNSLRIGVFGRPASLCHLAGCYSHFFRHANASGFANTVRVEKSSEIIRIYREFGYNALALRPPFSSELLPLVDDLCEAAKVIGSADTVIVKGGKLKGFNSLFLASVVSIKHCGVNPHGAKSVVLGCGERQRAVAYGLCREGARVILVDENPALAEETAMRLSCDWTTMDRFGAVVKDASVLVVDGTDAGCRFAASDLSRKLLVLDLGFEESSLEAVFNVYGCRLVPHSVFLGYFSEISFRHMLHAQVALPMLINAKEVESFPNIAIGVVWEGRVLLISGSYDAHGFSTLRGNQEDSVLALFPSLALSIEKGELITDSFPSVELGQCVWGKLNLVVWTRNHSRLEALGLLVGELRVLLSRVKVIA